jgi:hypothetical protein
MIGYAPPLLYVFLLECLIKHRGNCQSLSLHGIMLKMKNKEFSRRRFTVLKTHKSTYFPFLFFLFTLFLFLPV